jgi:hypothetical protein
VGRGAGRERIERCSISTGGVLVTGLGRHRGRGTGDAAPGRR